MSNCIKALLGLSDYRLSSRGVNEEFWTTPSKHCLKRVCRYGGESNPTVLWSISLSYSVSLQWLRTMPVKDALLNKQQEQRIFKTVFHYHSILVSRRNFIHTPTPKLSKQNWINMAEAYPSLKKHSCTVAPKPKSQASQCPLFVFSVGSNQRYPLQPTQNF